MPWKESGVVEERMRFVHNYERGDDDGGTVPVLWHRSQDRVREGGAVARAGSGGVKGPEPVAAAASQPNGAGDRGGAARVAAGPNAWGTTQATGDAGCATAESSAGKASLYL
jgi:hypothetical protein